MLPSFYQCVYVAFPPLFLHVLRNFPLVEAPLRMLRIALFAAIETHHCSEGVVGDFALSLIVIFAVKNDINEIAEKYEADSAAHSANKNRAAAREACDLCIFQLQGRFSDAEYVEAFNLIDPSPFSSFRIKFPGESSSYLQVQSIVCLQRKEFE